jgi:hypothetical protein
MRVAQDDDHVGTGEKQKARPLASAGRNFPYLISPFYGAAAVPQECFRDIG